MWVGQPAVFEQRGTIQSAQAAGWGLFIFDPQAAHRHSTTRHGGFSGLHGSHSPRLRLVSAHPSRALHKKRPHEGPYRQNGATGRLRCLFLCVYGRLSPGKNKFSTVENVSEAVA